MIGEILLFGLFDMFVTQILKVWVKSKALVQLIVLAIAIIIGLCTWYWQYLPQQTIQTIVGIWVAAVGIYEILIKRIYGDVVKVAYSKVLKSGKKSRKK